MAVKAIASVVLHGLPWTKAKRKKLANWLRGRANLLEDHGDLMAKRFIARYYETENPKNKASTR